MSMNSLMPERNLVNMVAVIFCGAYMSKNKSSRQLADFLLKKAQSRGYCGKLIESLGKEDKQLIADSVIMLCFYICLHDIREMSGFCPEKNEAGGGPLFEPLNRGGNGPGDANLN